MLRKPCVAGQFYPSDFKNLENQIKECFLHKKGPGALAITKRKGKVKAVIVPHAGYSFSGPCASWAYKEIAEADFPDTFVLLGPNHKGIGRTSISNDDWETPFGVVRNDKVFGKTISRFTGIEENNEPHLYEHSIEVQLPFLQFVSKDNLDKLKIVPISIREDIDLKKVSLGLKEAIIDSNKEVCFIVSSDFTHYGPGYRYVPFELDKQKRLYELDKGAIDLIKKSDANGFLDYIYQTGATICGALPIALLLNTIKTHKISLLQYYTSGDIVNNYKNAVGYASILFK